MFYDHFSQSCSLIKISNFFGPLIFVGSVFLDLLNILFLTLNFFNTGIEN